MFKFNFDGDDDESAVGDGGSPTNPAGGGCPNPHYSKYRVSVGEGGQAVWQAGTRSGPVVRLPTEDVHFSASFKLTKSVGRSEEIKLQLAQSGAGADYIEQLASSDVVQGVYEGGFKLWECARDLVEYLLTQPALMAGASVLEAGAGHALPGLCSLRHGARAVCLQDYNDAVVELVTVPNALANSADLARCTFLACDWDSLAARYAAGELPRVDLLLTSDTLYTVPTLTSLYALVRAALQPPHGTALVAAKLYYFACGGGTDQFRAVVERDGVFACTRVALVEDGNSNIREILRLTFLREEQAC